MVVLHSWLMCQLVIELVGMEVKPTTTMKYRCEV